MNQTIATDHQSNNSVSVLILTLNEEQNLPCCLASVAWSDDIVVLDSGSTDRTIEIAKAAGARVVHRVLDNWSGQQNWATANIQFKHSWVFYLDADETADEKLGREVMEVTRSGPEDLVAYRLRRKETLWGKWIKHSSMYPVWHLRMFRPGKVRWQRLVHPEAIPDGPTGRLKGHLVHDSFSKGLEPWIAKHITYAELEAIEALKVLDDGEFDFAGLFLPRKPVRRRRAMKLLRWYLPFRPLWRFLYMYVFRMGFLDGIPGYNYCRLLAMYQFMIDCNMKELRRRRAGLPV